MTQATAPEEIMDTLTGIKQDVDHLKQDLHYLIEFIENTRLSAEEKKLLDESITKVKEGNTSGFIAHENLKKELGL